MQQSVRRLLTTVAVAATASLIVAAPASAAYTFLNQWGSTTTSGEVGKFQFVQGVAVAPDGSVLVSEHGSSVTNTPASHRVQRFAPTGEYLSYFGTFGTGPVQFNATGPLAVDSQGNTIVADPSNDRIQKISPGGTMLWQAGNTGVGAGPGRGREQIIGAGNPTLRGAAGELDSPGGVAVGPDDSVWVVDTSTYRVSKYSSNGAFLMSIGAGVGGAGVNVCTVTCAAGSYGGSTSSTPPTAFGLNWPQDVAVDASGNLYVSDRGHSRITKYAPDGTPMSFPTSNTSTSPYYVNSGDAGLAFDVSTGRLYAVVDDDQVAVFSPTGSYLGDVGTSVGACATGATVCYMSDVAARNGHIYLAGDDRLIRHFLDGTPPVVVPPVDPPVTPPVDPGPPVVPTQPGTTTPPAGAPPVPPTPPPAPKPPADTTPPGSKLIVASSVTVPSTGAVSMQVQCLEAAGASCTTTVALSATLTQAQLTGRAKPAKPVIISLGAKSISVKGGTKASVKIVLSAKNRALLVRLRSIRTAVKVTVKDAAGNARATTKVIVLRAPAPTRPK